MINVFSFFLISNTLNLFNRKIGYIFGIIFVISLAHMRRGGPDYNDYLFLLQSFEYASINVVGGGVEPIWLMLVYIFDLFNLNTNARFATIAAISYSIHFFAISKFFPQSKNLFTIAILIYLANDFIVRDLGQIRNGLASSLFLLGFVYHYLKNSYRSYLSYIFAILFHSSFIFPIFMTFLYFRFGLRAVVLLIPIIFLGIYFVINNIQLLINFLDLNVLYRVMDYTQSENYLGNFDGAGIPIFFIVSLFLFFLGLITIKNFNYEQRSFIALYFTSIISFIAFYDFVVIASRLSTTFTTLNCLFIPLLMQVSNYANSYFNLSKLIQLFFVMIGLIYMFAYVKTYGL